MEDGNSKEVRFIMMPYATLDDVVKYLQLMKNDKINYCARFAGHMFYSDTVNFQLAYKEVYPQDVYDFLVDTNFSPDPSVLKKTNYFKNQSNE